MATPIREAGTDRAARSAFHRLPVANVEPLTDDSAAITFTVPPELCELYAFAAGQSVTIRRTIDGVDERRTYSICAPVGHRLRIGVREIPDGLFSHWLVREVQPGELVEVQPPSGSFRLDQVGRPGDDDHGPVAELRGSRHLCIAAGSGITPMLSIVSSILAAEADVTLLYGNRTATSVMFAEELADLKNAHPSTFDLVHVLSREPREVELFSGRLDAGRLRQLLTVLIPVSGIDQVWLCGPFGMLTDARTVLDELGVDPSRVHFELFYVDQPPPELRHADPTVAGLTSDVTVTLDGRSATRPMPRDRSILDSAQRTRSDLPFACKGGVCGTCRAKLCSGQVDMVRNYALSPHELEQGFILCCQSYPSSDVVTVDFDA